MLATGVLGTPRKPNFSNPAFSSPAPQAQLHARASANMLSSLGLPFNPYNHTPLPTRILATGAAANFPSVADLVGDIFNAPVLVPSSQWMWARDRDGMGVCLGGFEEEGRRMLGERWVAMGRAALRTNVNGMVSGSGVGAGSAADTSYRLVGAGLGASTGIGCSRSGLGLGAAVFVWEEDKELERERNSRMQTQTDSTVDSLGSLTNSGLSGPSTVFTTPDIQIHDFTPTLARSVEHLRRASRLLRSLSMDDLNRAGTGWRDGRDEHIDPCSISPEDGCGWQFASYNTVSPCCP
ncbi:hypothetical protein B0H34DRAFT_793377 [Crassisporium funariophilum]|nr:hypothetical protein B0H34DRAFT_793377 [Crassisporium funariophilum]